MAPWDLVISINACNELIRSMFIPIMGHLAVLPHLMQARHCDWAILGHKQFHKMYIFSTTKGIICFASK